MDGKAWTKIHTQTVGAINTSYPHIAQCLAQLLHAAAERLSDHQQEAGLMHNYTRLQPIKKHRFANLRSFSSAVQSGAKSHSFRSFLKVQEFRPDVLAEWMKNNWKLLHSSFPSIHNSTRHCFACIIPRKSAEYIKTSIILPRETMYRAGLPSQLPPSELESTETQLKNFAICAP